MYDLKETKTSEEGRTVVVGAIESTICLPATRLQDRNLCIGFALAEYYETLDLASRIQCMQCFYLMLIL